MPNFSDWVSAARPRTLPLAVSGLALGNFIAAFHGAHSWAISIGSILTATFLQILSNLANDYGDYMNGADNADRLGPERAVQSGKISINTMKKAIALFVVLSLGSGIALLWLASDKINVLYLLVMLGLGVLAVGAAIKYTATDSPYGYKGLGDLAVFLFFGLLAVMGSFYLQTGMLTPELLLPASAFGFLSTGVLNLNNLRDIENDKAVGKITIAVRLGLQKGKKYHFLLIGAATLLFVLFAFICYSVFYQYLFLIPLTLLLGHSVKVHKRKTYAELNPLLKELALSSSLIAFSFGIGLII